MTNPLAGHEMRIDRPHGARIYDYFLGGKDNYAVDRVAADAVIAEAPGILVSVRANRQFMQRSLRWVAEQGVDQFLDIGTGIPTAPNLHQIVQDVRPTSRVVYVDHDPIVLAHAAALMIGDPRGRTVYVEADARDIDKILEAPELRATIDLSQPVGLSAVALLHFIVDDEEAKHMLGALLAAVPSGSYLVLSHGTADFQPEQAGRAARAYRQSGVDLKMRSKAELELLFADAELIDPGVVEVQYWRPDGEPAYGPGQVGVIGGVARKP